MVWMNFPGLKWLWGLVATLLIISSSMGQTTRKALDYQKEFEQKVQFLNQKMGQLHLNLWQGEGGEKTKDIQSEVSKMARKTLGEFQGKPAFIGQENLKLAYIRYIQTLLNEIENVNKPIENQADIVSSDSLNKKKENWIRSWTELTNEAKRLKSEVDNFAMANRIPGRKSLTSSADEMNFALGRMELANSFLKPVQTVRLQFQDFFQRMISDSLSQIEFARLSLLQTCEKAILEAKAVAPFPDDKEIKNGALNSLRLYRLEIVNDLPQVVTFVKKERSFVELHQGMKNRSDLSESEKARYKQAVADYNQNLKQANDFIKAIEKQRKEHELVFDRAFFEFLRLGLPGN